MCLCVCVCLNNHFFLADPSMQEMLETVVSTIQGQINVQNIAKKPTKTNEKLSLQETASLDVIIAKYL